MTAKRVAFAAAAAFAALVTVGASARSLAGVVRFASVPRTALQGSTQAVSATVARGARCSLAVKYADGQKQVVGTTFAVVGTVHWIWQVPPVAKAGPATLTAACGRAGSAVRRVTVFGDLVAPKIVVEKQGFSIRPRSTGSTASYGLLLRNTSPNVDALAVQVIVNFVMADGHLIGTASNSIQAIPAATTFAYGGSLSFPGAAPVVSLEVVVQIGGVQRRDVHQPALDNIRVLPNRSDATWVGEVDGELINDHPSLQLRSATLYTVILDASGQILGGGTGNASVVLPCGTREAFVIRSSLDAIPWARAASAIVSTVPTYGG